MGDWADDKAREWLEVSFGPPYPGDGGYAPSIVKSLAALLREVAGSHVAHIQWTDPGRDHLMRKDVLAEVRRVVTEEACHWDHCTETILRRLEKL